jgi:hypothetical protein
VLVWCMLKGLHFGAGVTQLCAETPQTNAGHFAK